MRGNDDFFHIYSLTKYRYKASKYGLCYKATKRKVSVRKIDTAVVLKYVVKSMKRIDGTFGGTYLKNYKIL